jgi:hypothetical protein
MNKEKKEFLENDMWKIISKECYHEYFSPEEMKYIESKFPDSKELYSYSDDNHISIKLLAHKLTEKSKFIRGLKNDNYFTFIYDYKNILIIKVKYRSDHEYVPNHEEYYIYSDNNLDEYIKDTNYYLPLTDTELLIFFEDKIGYDNIILNITNNFIIKILDNIEEWEESWTTDDVTIYIKKLGNNYDTKYYIKQSINGGILYKVVYNDHALYEFASNIDT